MGRTFESGASRNADEGKLDFEAFISPNALRAFAEYMDENAWLNEERRAGDNWQKGIPTDVYVKSLWRHFFDVWAIHRGVPTLDVEDMKHALGGVLFNAFGLLHELTKPRPIARCGALGGGVLGVGTSQCTLEQGHAAHIAHVYGAVEAPGGGGGGYAGSSSQSSTSARTARPPSRDDCVTCPRCFGEGRMKVPMGGGTVRCELCLGAGECSRARASGVIE